MFVIVKKPTAFPTFRPWNTTPIGIEILYYNSRVRCTFFTHAQRTKIDGYVPTSGSERFKKTPKNR